MAVKKLNSKYDSVTASDKSVGEGKIVSGEASTAGTFEAVLSSQIETFERTMKAHLSSFVAKTNQMEESFLDKIDIASRH